VPRQTNASSNELRKTEKEDHETGEVPPEEVERWWDGNLHKLSLFSFLHLDQSKDMKHEIQGNPDYGDLKVWLEPGEAIWAESGAMSRMSRHLEVKTRMVGGFLKAAVRKMVGGESLFVAEYHASRPGFVCFSPAIPGTVLHRTLREDSFYLTRGSFLACTPGMELRTRFGGLKAFFSGEGAFFIECQGSGEVFYNAYGGIVEKDLDGEYTVDTGHLVAWEPTLDYSIGGMGGIKQTLFSGEGLVMKFRGQGKIYLQTRHLGGMAGWLSGFCR
jgi:uncharacterized protein (TIGR00266 family)